MTIRFEAIRERWQADPAYRNAYFEMDFAVAFAMAAERHRSAQWQAERTERIGTSQAMIARWETGRSAPTMTPLRRFAEATGARINLVFETDDIT